MNQSLIIWRLWIRRSCKIGATIHLCLADEVLYQVELKSPGEVWKKLES